MHWQRHLPLLLLTSALARLCGAGGPIGSGGGSGVRIPGQCLDEAQRADEILQSLTGAADTLTEPSMNNLMEGLMAWRWPQGPQGGDGVHVASDSMHRAAPIHCMMSEALALARSNRRAEVRALERNGGKPPEKAAPRAGAVVHRYSGEVLLRPRTCRVVVDTDESASNLRALAWYKAAMAREKNEPWVVQLQRQPTPDVLTSHDLHEDIAGNMPVTGWWGGLAQAMLQAQDSSVCGGVALPLAGPVYERAQAVSQPESALTRASKSKSQPSALAHPIAAAQQLQHWPCMTRALVVSLPGTNTSSPSARDTQAHLRAVSWERNISELSAAPVRLGLANGHTCNRWQSGAGLDTSASVCVGTKVRDHSVGTRKRRDRKADKTGGPTRVMT